MLYGRGAVDMKGAIACKIAAALDYLGDAWRQAEGLDLVPDHRRRGRHRGQRHREAAAMGGRARREIRPLHSGRADQSADARRHDQDRPARLAERHAGRHRHAGARRLSGARRQSGARPRHADRRAINAEPLDSGTAHFGPSNLEFTSIDVGNKTVNLIPAEARARFNIRFNDTRTREELRALKSSAAPRRRPATRSAGSIDWEPSNADVFLTTPGPFVEMVGEADRRGDRASRRSCRPPAARRTRASSRIIAR